MPQNSRYTRSSAIFQKANMHTIDLHKTHTNIYLKKLRNCVSYYLERYMRHAGPLYYKQFPYTTINVGQKGIPHPVSDS